MAHKISTPTLDQLLANGTVKKSADHYGAEYYGVAADGTEVALGTVGKESTAESYLAAHPTPDTW